MVYNKNMVKFFMNILEEDYKIEKIKKLNKSLMSLLLSPFIIYSFIWFLKIILKNSSLNI